MKGMEFYPVIFLTGLAAGCFSNACINLKCGCDKKKILAGYLHLALLNGIIYVWVFTACGLSGESFLFCICSSLLFVLGVIDERTFEIPVGCNIMIGMLGMAHLIIDFENWREYVAGMCMVSSFLLLIYFVTKEKGIGGGDVKLMAAAGLLLGWEKIALSLFVGAVTGLAVHPVLMKLKGKSRVFALGPYLSFGIFVAMLYGDRLLIW